MKSEYAKKKKLVIDMKVKLQPRKQDIHIFSKIMIITMFKLPTSLTPSRSIFLQLLSVILPFSSYISVFNATYCHVQGVRVTNNGFWIGWLDLLMLFYNYT
jgi:hypothetical protein